MNIYKYILTSLLLILNFCLIGQNSISGVVTDEISKEKLAFVNIVELSEPRPTSTAISSLKAERK